MAVHRAEFGERRQHEEADRRHIALARVFVLE
jgi:hypothetical protein